MSDEQKTTAPAKGGIKNPTKLYEELDKFKVTTKQQINDFSYTVADNEEDEFDPLTMLAGIADEDLDMESLHARRRAADKLAQKQEAYTK